MCLKIFTECKNIPCINKFKAFEGKQAAANSCRRWFFFFAVPFFPFTFLPVSSILVAMGWSVIHNDLQRSDLEKKDIQTDALLNLCA